MTIVLADRSIADIQPNGTVLLYPSPSWRKPRNATKNFIGFHEFKFRDFEQAFSVFEIISKHIADEQIDRQKQ